jgi:hypothetical protein
MPNEDQTISGVQSASQSCLAKMYKQKKTGSLVNLMPQHILYRSPIILHGMDKSLVTSSGRSNPHACTVQYCMKDPLAEMVNRHSYGVS